MSIENKEIPDHRVHKEQFEDAEIMIDAQKQRELNQSLVQLKEELSGLKDTVNESKTTISDRSEISGSLDHRTKVSPRDSHTHGSFVKNRIHAMNPTSSLESNIGREKSYTRVSDFVSTSVSQLPFGLHKFFSDA